MRVVISNVRVPVNVCARIASGAAAIVPRNSRRFIPAS
jgi:hypothetical protein